MRSFWQHLFGAPDPVMSHVKPRPAKPRGTRGSAPAAAPAPSPSVSPAAVSEGFHRFVFALPAAGASEPSAPGAALLKRLELLSTRFDMRSLPRLPTVLPQLLRTLKSETAAGGELARLVGRDPLMVGEVMRVTGSVYYRTAQPIASLQQAVVLLGQDGLRRVITQHAMKPILQANAGGLGHAGDYLWDHAERCAHVCAWLAKHKGGDAFEAYLAGIICHTGTGAVVRLLGHLLADAPTPVLDAHFIGQCAALGARLTLQAAQHWELPPRVVAALNERQQSDRVATSALGQALVAADTLAMAHLLGGQGLLPVDANLSTAWPESFRTALLERCQTDLRRHFREPA
ncbi:MAG: HDOD domain-containing protein [Rhodanobacter sp.]